MVGDAHDEAHVVLDEQHGQLVVRRGRADELAELADLLVVEAAGRLVEQQQPRPRDQRAGELDALQRPVGQRRRRGASGELARGRRTSSVSSASGSARRAAARVCAPTGRSRAPSSRGRARCSGTSARSPADDPVRRASRAGLARRTRARPRRLVEPGDHVEDRRLARAVRADQPDDLPLARRRTRPVERDDARRSAGSRPRRRGAPRGSSLKRRATNLRGHACPLTVSTASCPWRESWRG